MKNIRILEETCIYDVVDFFRIESADKVFEVLKKMLLGQFPLKVHSDFVEGEVSLSEKQATKFIDLFREFGLNGARNKFIRDLEQEIKSEEGCYVGDWLELNSDTTSLKYYMDLVDSLWHSESAKDLFARPCVCLAVQNRNPVEHLLLPYSNELLRKFVDKYKEPYDEYDHQNLEGYVEKQRSIFVDMDSCVMGTLGSAYMDLKNKEMESLNF